MLQTPTRQSQDSFDGRDRGSAPRAEAGPVLPVLPAFQRAPLQQHDVADVERDVIQAFVDPMSLPGDRKQVQVEHGPQTQGRGCLFRNPGAGTDHGLGQHDVIGLQIRFSTPSLPASSIPERSINVWIALVSPRRMSTSPSCIRV